jgi:hypothetical protein
MSPQADKSHSTDTFTTPLRRPPVRVGRPTSATELRMLCACAARHCEECGHLRSELRAMPTDNQRAVDYAQHLLDEAETAWQICIDRICATSCRSLDGLIEKARVIVDARIMREAGAYTEDAEIRIATSIALDLLAWREKRS